MKTKEEISSYLKIHYESLIQDNLKYNFFPEKDYEQQYKCSLELLDYIYTQKTGYINDDEFKQKYPFDVLIESLFLFSGFGIVKWEFKLKIENEEFLLSIEELDILKTNQYYVHPNTFQLLKLPEYDKNTIINFLITLPNDSI